VSDGCYQDLVFIIFPRVLLEYQALQDDQDLKERREQEVTLEEEATRA